MLSRYLLRKCAFRRQLFYTMYDEIHLRIKSCVFLITKRKKFPIVYRRKSGEVII
jgi:hypothetical protein